MLTHREIIGLWPSNEEFAADAGCELWTAKAWKQRDHIPDGYWLAIVAGAAARRLRPRVTLEVLARARAEKLAVMAPLRSAVGKKAYAARRAAETQRAIA